MIVRIYIIYIFLSFFSIIYAQDTVDAFPINDENNEFEGRWIERDGIKISHWPGATIRTRFNGTSVAFRNEGTVAGLGGNINYGIFAVIDKQRIHNIHFSNRKIGIIQLARYLDPHKIHTIEIVAGEFSSIHFGGFIFDGNATSQPEHSQLEDSTPFIKHLHTQTPFRDRQIIEFIGDSITAGADTSNDILSSYAWLTGRAMNLRTFIVAQSGIHLMSNEQMEGMENQYFFLGNNADVNDRTEPWLLGEYEPDIIIVNIGTNDHFYNGNFSLVFPEYLDSMVDFLSNLREVHEDSEIFVLRPFFGYTENQAEEAVQIRRMQGDTKTRLIDTTGWVRDEDYKCNNRQCGDWDRPGLCCLHVHPLDNGHRDAAARLIPLLAPYVKHFDIESTNWALPSLEELHSQQFVDSRGLIIFLILAGAVGMYIFCLDKRSAFSVSKR